MKPSSNARGYLQVNLNPGHRCKKVARLVAEAFIPNPENKPQVNHKNGIKTDNHVENLEWVTNSENAAHASRNGLKLRKLSPEDVKKIRLLCSKGVVHHEVGSMFGVHQVTVSKIYRREAWGWF